MGHLAEDTVGDVVVTAPVGGALGVGELIHIVAVQLTGQFFRRSINFTGALHEMAAAAVKLNLFDFSFCGAGRHDGDEWQPKQASEIGFGYRRRTGRRFNNGGAFLNPAVAQAVKEQRARQTVLQAAGRVGAFVFKVQLNAGKGR